MQDDMRPLADPRRDPNSPCSHCGSAAAAYRWQTFANGTRHIRVNCGRCGAYVRYAPQTTENIARADAAASMGRAS